MHRVIYRVYIFDAHAACGFVSIFIPGKVLLSIDVLSQLKFLLQINEN